MERSILEDKVERLQSRLDQIRQRLTQLRRNDYAQKCFRLETEIYHAQARRHELKNKKAEIEEFLNN